MRKAGGVLTIIGGIIVIGIGAVIMGEWLGVFSVMYWFGAFGAPLIAFGIVALIVGIVALIVGIVALIGGIYALRARVWGFALAGGIIVIGIGGVIMSVREWIMVVSEHFLFPLIAWLIAFGILGTIFIALRKGEFE